MSTKYLNFNIGILGHVDSGKTSLAKTLSTIASTAAFDKNPQSQERGITIDLGFSSFCVDAPENILSHGYQKVQFTLVDCPGHASLIRTIIGGAKIIDAMMLIIDVTKGMQTQTAECLIIGEILCKDMIVVLNKVDLLPKDKQKGMIEKLSKKLHNTLKNTKFLNSKIVAVAANPNAEEYDKPIGIEELILVLKQITYIPDRQLDKPFVFSVDHCFGIRGQGTVITGTVLQGSIAVNNDIEIPSLKVTKKVKSMQMFRNPVEKASQGDRVGICVTQFDPKLLERSLIGANGHISLAQGFICEVHRISYYKQNILSKAKFHISMGHATVLATVMFFGTSKKLTNIDNFNMMEEYLAQAELIDTTKNDDNDEYTPAHQFALVEFESIIPLTQNSIFIASKLDMDVHTNMCRLAFWGKVSLMLMPDIYKTETLPKLKVYKNKSREGTVERMNNDSELIVKNLLKKGTDITLFSGLKLQLSTGEKGYIDSYFGKSGKVNICLTTNLFTETKTKLMAMNENRKKGKKTPDDVVQQHLEPVKVNLKFKKYMFGDKKKIVQS